MPDDRKKMLEALAAKRKAEADGGVRKKPKAASFPPPSKPVAGKGASDKPKAASFRVKEKVQPKKKKRVEKYESEGSEAEDEEEEDSVEDVVSSELEGDSLDDSEEETLKKSSKGLGSFSKGKAPLKSEGKGKPLKGLGSNEKGKVNVKGKGPVKDKGKVKRKGDDSSDEGVYDEDDSGNLSEDPLDEVDPTNILSSRTRRQTTQPVRYDFGDLSGDDDDDSDA